MLIFVIFQEFKCGHAEPIQNYVKFHTFLTTFFLYNFLTLTKDRYHSAVRTKYARNEEPEIEMIMRENQNRNQNQEILTESFEEIQVRAGFLNSLSNTK